MNQADFTTPPSRRISPIPLLHDKRDFSESLFCREVTPTDSDEFIPEGLIEQIENLCLGPLWKEQNILKTGGDTIDGSTDDYGASWTYTKLDRVKKLTEFDDGSSTHSVLHLHYSVNKDKRTFTCKVNSEIQDILDSRREREHRSVNVFYIEIVRKETLKSERCLSPDT